MTVYEIGRRKFKATFKLFEFEDMDSMLLGTVGLYKRHRSTLKSSLYKMPSAYRLLVYPRVNSDFFFMNEFCFHQSESETEAAYTEEYGKLLVKNNAVKLIGKAFSKGF